MRYSRASLALLLAALGLAAPAGTTRALAIPSPGGAPPASTGVTSASGIWRWQNPLPQGNTLSAATCPDRNTCYAVGSGTVMSSHDAGRHWTITFDKAPGTFTALSCPGSLTCYAITDTGPGTVAILGSKDGGATWTRLWHGKQSLEHLACPSTDACYAAGQYASALLTTTNGGATWLHRTPPLHPVAIACPGTATCYTPLATNLITSPPPSVAVTTDGGATWTARRVGIPRGAAQLDRLACPGISTCTVLAYGDAGTLGAALALRTDDGGTTWHRQSLPRQAPFRGGIITCPTLRDCYVAGDNGVIRGVLVTTANAGRTWVHARSLPFVPAALACAGKDRCLAAGNGGALLVATSSWAKRTQVTHNALRYQTTNPSTALRAITCPSKNVCYAAGDFGNAVKTIDAGSHWTALGSSFAHQSHAGSITSLACAGTNTCYAGLAATSLYRAMVISTRDGGRTWSAKPGSGLASVACPGRSVCFAGGSRGTMQVTRNGGRTWTRQRLPLNGKPYEIQQLICPSALACYGTARGPSEPPPHPISNVGALVATSDGGRSWRVSYTDPYPFSLACTTSTDCVALIAGDAIHQTTATIATHDGGRTWTKQTIVPSGYWQSVTCSGTTCHLAGGGGRIAASHDGAATWEEESTPTFNALNAITCTSAGTCYAAGMFGTILSRRVD